MTLSLASSSSGDMFESCRVEKGETGERTIECKDFMASLSKPQPEFIEAQILDLVFDGLKQSGFSAKHTSLKVEGRSRRAIRYLKVGAKEAGLFVSLRRAEGRKVQLAGCEAPGDFSCDEVIQGLATGPAPAANLVDPDEKNAPMVGTRALEIANGCERPTSSVIKCRSARLSWSRLSKTDRKGSKWLIDPIKSAFSKLGTVSERKKGCAAFGAASHCRVFEMSGEGGEKKAIMAAVVSQPGKKRFFLQCNMAGALSDKPPEPCAQVFRLR